jgi:hypothetical protein
MENQKNPLIIRKIKIVRVGRILSLYPFIAHNINRPTRNFLIMHDLACVRQFLVSLLSFLACGNQCQEQAINEPTITHGC